MPRKPNLETKRADAQTDKNPLGLKAADYNPRKPWEPEQVDAFKASLREYGDLSGIVKNRTTGNLVGGHKRVDVLSQDEGAKVVAEACEPDGQGTVARGYILLSDGTRFSYREVKWPKKKEQAANLAANKWGAEWDWEGVSKMLQRLAGGELDLTTLGFPQHELDALLQADWTPPVAGAMPSAQGEGGEIDKMFLSKDARAALDRWKAQIQQPDDAEAVRLACEAAMTK